MGMYDNVNFECACPKCGAIVTGFQTKDRDCVLDTLEISQVDYFTGWCRHDGCDTTIDFQRKRFVQPFEMFVGDEIQDAEVTEKVMNDWKSQI